MNIQTSIIAVIGRNRELGKNGQLLWRIPEDLAYFKKVTMGVPVIMGRKTWESLPAAFRPLPGRVNIVVTRDKSFAAKGCLIAHSMEEAIEMAKAQDCEEIFVIGGAQIYEQALAFADRLYLTRVDAEDHDADAYFPQYEEIFTKEISIEEHDNGKHKFSFVVLEK